MKKISIVIPVYNEEKYLPDFIQNLMKYVKKSSQIFQILFVNDGSTDLTQEIIHIAQKKHKNIAVITNTKNRGKGYSMRVGFRETRKRGAQAVLFMDGDGQHDPVHIQQFIDKLTLYPVVFGYRELKKNTPLVRKLGNKISSIIIRNIFRIDRKGDILCGYFALRKDIFTAIHWHSNDYGVEAEISAIIGRKLISFKEILVKTIYLNESKGVNMFHAVRIFLRIPYWNIVHSYE